MCVCVCVCVCVCACKKVWVCLFYVIDQRDKFNSLISCWYISFSLVLFVCVCVFFVCDYDVLSL